MYSAVHTWWTHTPARTGARARIYPLLWNNNRRMKMKENEKVIISGRSFKIHRSRRSRRIVLCVRSFSLSPPFTVFPHYLALSLPLSRLSSRRGISCLTFPQQAELLYTGRIQRRDIYTIDVQCDQCRCNARKEMRPRYVCTYTCPAVYVAAIYLFSRCILSVDLSISRSVYIERRCTTINSNLRW